MAAIPFKSTDLGLSSSDVVEELISLRQQLCDERALASEFEWLATRSAMEVRLLRIELEKLEDALSLAQGQVSAASDLQNSLEELQLSLLRSDDQVTFLTTELNHARVLFEDAVRRLRIIEKSRSFRIGRIVTAPMRCLKSLLASGEQCREASRCS